MGGWWGEAAQLMVGVNRSHKPSQRRACNHQGLPLGLAIQSLLLYLSTKPRRTQTVPQGLGETFQSKTTTHAYSSMSEMPQCPLEMTAKFFDIT